MGCYYQNRFLGGVSMNALFFLFGAIFGISASCLLRGL